MTGRLTALYFHLIRIRIAISCVRQQRMSVRRNVLGFSGNLSIVVSNRRKISRMARWESASSIRPMVFGRCCPSTTKSLSTPTAATRVRMFAAF